MIPKQAYTTEFNELAVKRVTGGNSIAVMIKELGLGEQTLRNWVKRRWQKANLKALVTRQSRQRQWNCRDYEQKISHSDSRYVNSANAIAKNWSKQEKSLTLCAPRWAATHRRKVVSGKYAMTWEKTSLPWCMRVFGGYPQKAPILRLDVQIETR